MSAYGGGAAPTRVHADVERSVVGLQVLLWAKQLWTAQQTAQDLLRDHQLWSLL